MNTPANTYLWLIRREFWENRAIWIVPLAFAALLTVGELFGNLYVVHVLTPDQQRVVGQTILITYSISFFVVMSIYASWYLLECLHADRKDRSILFWKSLPISDAGTVIAKLATGVLVIPLVYFAVSEGATLLMAFIVSIRAHAFLGSSLWQPSAWLQLNVLWLYAIVTSALWFLPLTGWFLLISAWAKRAVILWCVLPPLAACWFESQFLGSHVLLGELSDRTIGYLGSAFALTSPAALQTTTIGSDLSIPVLNVWRTADPLGFFTSAATWIGVLIGAAMIYAAVQLRLRRAEV